MNLWGQEKTRRALALLAIGLVSVGIAACGSSDGSTSTAGTGAESSTAAKSTASDKDKANHGEFPLPVKGGSYDEEHPGTAKYGSPPLPIEADPSGAPAFTAKKVMAREGNVTIEFTNPQPNPRNITIELLPSHEKESSETVEEGFAAFTITLNRQTKYVLYSSLPGDRKAGMEAEIEVTKP